MKAKTTYIILGIIVAAVIAFFVFKKKTDAVSSSPVAVGLRKSGKPYYEADILKSISDIKASPDWFNMIKTNATTEGMDLELALRKNAIYVLDNDTK